MRKKQRCVFIQPKKKSLLSRIIRKSIWLSLGIVIVLGIGSYYLLNLSQAQYEGSTQVKFLQERVSIERDSKGSVKLTAQSRQDLSFALGFTHAQERLFQMDLLRRKAAGELSELFGTPTLEIDKQTRLHQFRKRAQAILSSLPLQDLQLLMAYTQGVNEGVAQLGTQPFEYWLTQNKFTPWKEEDSILVVFAMYLTLQPSSVEKEKTLQFAQQNLSTEWYEFLFPAESFQDAPIDFSESITPPFPSTPLELKHNSPMALSTQPQIELVENIIGSNNFAIAGSRSNSKKAIIAGDMHLGLDVPNIWFKAELINNDQIATSHLSGVTLPGTPILIAGTNQHIAWTFTNSYGDYSDVKKLMINPENRNRYTWQENDFEFSFENELIKVKNAEPENLQVTLSHFGPVLEQNTTTAWAYLWVAHNTNGINLNIIQLEQSKTVDQAVSIAKSSAIPAQNFVVGDEQGNIGWTIIGPLPQRLPSENATSTLGIKTETILTENGNILWLAPEKYPELVNPESGALWTANGRVVGGNSLIKIGTAGYANGVRGELLKEQLLKLTEASETDLLNIQLSTKADLYKPWQNLLMATLQKSINQLPSDELSMLLSIINSWNGHSDKNQTALTFIKKFREQVYQAVLGDLITHIVPEAKRSFSYYSSQYEQVIWQLLNNNFLPLKPNAQLDEVLTDALNKTIESFSGNNKPLFDYTWGEQNQLNIKHPISRAVPLLGYFLDRPQYTMPGDAHSPRVQTPSFGASQRMVITPSELQSAIYHMPGGQSGHPLSPFYTEGFEDWVIGTPSSLATGDTIHRLELVPQP